MKLFSKAKLVYNVLYESRKQLRFNSLPAILHSITKVSNDFVIQKELELVINSFDKKPSRVLRNITTACFK